MAVHEHGGDLRGKAIRTIERYGMLRGGERIVASVSGGPDSVALLHFLIEIATGMDLTLSVFHLDHMIRGTASARDAEFVKALADEAGLPSRVVALDVANEPSARGQSPQEAARTIRLERLLDYAEEWRADRVATGHTADDQVETFLMRVVQGAGLTGLAGIPPVSGPLIRPLIEVWRFEVEDFLAARGAESRLDRTNLEATYLRNRVRLKLVPILVAEFGEPVKEVILREVETLATDREYFEDLASAELERIARVDEEQVTIDREELLAMPPSMQRGVIRQAWNRLLPDAAMLSWQHVSDIMNKVVAGNTGAVIDLPAGSVAEREYDDVIIRWRSSESELAAPLTLEVDGSAELPWGEVVTADYVEASEASFSGDPDIEYARGDIKTPLTVRTYQPGDRFRPLGAAYQRKLKDFFMDMKLPRRQRRRVPLVLEGDRIVWVAGLRLDERYRLRPTDERALRLRLRRGA